MSTTVKKTTGDKTDELIEKMKNNKHSKLIAAIICFIILIIAVWSGNKEISKPRKIKEDFTRTEAVVVSCYEFAYGDDDDDGNGNSSYYYSVNLEYTAGAEVYKYNYKNNSEKSIGDKMTLYYDPDNPKVVFSESDLSSVSFEGYAAFGFAAIMVLVIAVLLIAYKNEIKMKKRLRR